MDEPTACHCDPVTNIITMITRGTWGIQRVIMVMMSCGGTRRMRWRGGHLCAESSTR